MNLNVLNKEQKKAVIDIGGPMLVFAGAGSGKTRVLTYKIAYLIKEVGLPPENILAVTFTNKASQEMKQRIGELVDTNLSSITIGTFHSVGAQILRKHIHLINYTNNFTIYDQADSRALIKNVIKDMDIDLKIFDPKSTQTRISNTKNNMHSIEDLKKLAINHNDERFIEIFSNYIKILKENNAVDFDDLLIQPLELFKSNKDILNFYQNKFQYVLVDEYQDTNKPQFELVSLLSSKHKNIFVVGDDDQSIYGWRGADISNILNFQNVFNKSKVVKLEQNYRSTKNILEAAWNVVSKNTDRAEKKLWTEKEVGEKIEIMGSINEIDEANLVMNNILMRSDKYNITKDKFVILYRTNAQSRSLEDRFRRNGIPYQIIGGTKFYDRKEIKDILAYLKFIVNDKDSISFSRIINFPHRGIGKTTLDRIIKESSSNEFIKMLSNPTIKASTKQIKTLKKISIFFIKYIKRAQNDDPASIAKDLILDLKLKEFYENKMTIDSMDRWNNIQELIFSIEEYMQFNKGSKLSDYLEEVSLLTDVDRWNDKDDFITLMTIHSAKGLEFDHVYIVGLEEGLFPMQRMLEDSDIEEERRLFYVAMTRAQKTVCISYAKSRRKFGGQPNYTKQSRFIDEIPPYLFKLEKNISKQANLVHNIAGISNEINIKINSIVEHKIFGKGKVTNIEGDGLNSKITVLFYNNERKKLIYKYANLKVL